MGFCQAEGVPQALQSFAHAWWELNPCGNHTPSTLVSPKNADFGGLVKSFKNPPSTHEHFDPLSFGDASKHMEYLESDMFLPRSSVCAFCQGDVQHMQKNIRLSNILKLLWMGLFDQLFCNSSSSYRYHIVWSELHKSLTQDVHT